jgi:hypothetical protein
MRFSEAFSIARTAQDAWFDPILTVDTPLFIDPFLIFQDESGVFVGSHEEIVSFFNKVFKLIAQTQGEEQHPTYKKALQLLHFPEVSELCLGYTSKGTRGAGSGSEIARLTAGAMHEAIEAGLTEISHFEEVSLLRMGIGADRISDMTACLLRWRLTRYTLDVCRARDIATKAGKFRHGRFIHTADRWETLDAELPLNPETGRPVLLVPAKYLRDLPTISPEEFWDYCWVNENEILRDELGEDISKRVNKRDIITIARGHPEIRREFVRAAEVQGSKAYDVAKDRAGYLHWHDRTKAYCADEPLTLSVQSAHEFRRFLDELVGAFRHFVEERRGWELLWNDNGRPRKEAAAQRLFLGIVAHYCRANDVDVSPEANIGRGPVDFKFSKGFRHRAALEVKLARNKKLWHGLEVQLPTYMKAESLELGHFLVVAHLEDELNKLVNLANRAADAGATAGVEIRATSVYAGRDVPSASKA